MKFISWNVNGLRAVLNKGFSDFFENEDADFFAIQESKLQEDQLEFKPQNYYLYINSAVKKGYSGTIIYTKHKPISVSFDFNKKDVFDDEGRVITLEYDNFYFVNAYVPNSKDGLLRLPYRMDWEDELRNYLVELDSKKPVIYCGDLNVAHNEIDLKNPEANRKNPGFSDEERSKFSQLLNSGFSDTFRELYPEEVKYSWWSYRTRARDRNIGWRIDYFVVSKRLMESVKDSKIYDNIFGSDHCPVVLDIF